MAAAISLLLTAAPCVAQAPAPAPAKAPVPAVQPAKPPVAAAVVQPAKPAPARPVAARPAPAPAGPAPVVRTMPAAPTAPVLALATPQAFCEQTVKRLPNVSMSLCAQAQLTANGGRSVQGRPLFQRDVISPNAQLKVLVIGGIHGDELSSTALVLHWIQHAQQTPSNVHWRFVPLVNPDGMLLATPTRINARGVDLNRNFPTPQWDKEAPVYWKNRTKSDPRRFPGPQPLSEPESRWIHDEMERWKPNLIVSVHAPYGVLDFDGPTSPPQRLGRLYLDQVGIFPGSLGNFGGVHKRVPVVTIELPSAIRTPQEAEIRQMWLDLLRWMGDRLGAG